MKNDELSSRALWIQGKEKAAILQASLGQLAPGCSLVKVIASAISPGTESLVFHGQVPKELYSEMKVPYMEGCFDFPIKYGYSVVGEVVASEDWGLQGKLVHFLHPHQDLVHARNCDLFVFGTSIPPARATLASNLETAVNAVWDSRVTVGQKCLVTGFGIIGSLVARVLSKIAGVEVLVVDANAEKVGLAQKLGFGATTPNDIKSEFDLAFHASSSSEGLQCCIDAVGYEGKIIELSWYGNRETQVRFGGSFHSQRKSITASQVSNIPAHMQRRWDYRRRKEVVFTLLQDALFDAHITEAIAFEDLADYFNTGGLKKPGLGRVVNY